MSRLSLGTRLALISGTVAFVLLVAGYFALLPLQARATEEMVASHLRSLAETVSASYLVFDRERGAHPVGDALDEVGRLDLVQSVWVRNNAGEIIHHTARHTPAADLLEIQRPLQRRSSCVQCHGSQGGALGEITLVANMSVAAANMRSLRSLMLVIMVLVACGVVLVVGLLTKFVVTSPLTALTATMSRAEEGDFLVRAPTTRSDEIGMLAAAFNRMLAAITALQATGLEQEEDLRQAHHELELQSALEERNRAVEETNAHLERRLEEQTLLLNLTRAVTSTLELNAVLDEISQRVGAALKIDEFSILLFDDSGRRLEVVSTYGVPSTVDLTTLNFLPGEGISGRVAQSGRSILVNDTSQDPRYLHYKGLRPIDGSFLSVPLLAKGKVLGVLDFFRATTDAFDDHSVSLLTIVAGQAALAIENAQLFKAQIDLALTDALTELPNRRALDLRLVEEVHRARRFDNELSLLMVDIDHFKEFNDNHGHLLGDHVLKQVARTLRRQLRRVDTVTRFGGEEFCVVLVRTDGSRATEVAEKLRLAVEQRTYARIRTDRRLKITVSIGIATLTSDIPGPLELIDVADTALYQAKHAGRNQVRAASTS